MLSLQVKNALTLVAAKATALLAGTDRPATAHRAPHIGVQDERILKADKWHLASRAYAARDAVTKAKAANAATTKDLEARRAALAARRANLSTAQSLLASLASSHPSASSLSLPTSLPALNSRLAALSSALAAQALDAARVRRILALELLAVYALAPVERPLADPFLPVPLARSTYPPASSSTAAPRLHPPEPFRQSYTLATLALPPLSALWPAPSPTELEALLAHLAHLVRLLALYEGVVLPFTPLPSGFGPGRAGVRATPGWGVAQQQQQQQQQQDDEDESAPSSAPASRRKGAATTAGGPAESYPLVFSSSRKPAQSASSALTAVVTGSSSIGGPSSAKTPGGLDDEDVDDDLPDDLDARSARSSRSDLSSSHAAPSSRAAPARRRAGSSKRAKAVVTGAVALAFDLAFLAWFRAERGGGPGSAREVRVEDLDDLGALVFRAAGVEPEGGAEGQKSVSNPPSDPTVPPPLPRASDFPLSFAACVEHYTTLSLGASTVVLPSRRYRGANALDESAVVVGGRGEFEEDEEGEEDEDWDLVSV
ncbi:hypothetical protein Rhopal_000381-T1 [Rhodotorula paludigena]|uniref:Uncharacterized protein n=1 Tax=Rhodotorula paludigena TaxID=86838 RepID=A0AAV5GDL6_9BASI|nr:hypothetical protein Rhopal_000381-T1 [Rhodotorula paludigena]